jgi:integrase
MKKPQLMTPAARAQLMATACDALQQALCKVYDLWCDQHGLPHLSADDQDCHGIQARMGHRPEGDNPASWRRLRHLLPDASKVAKVEHHAALHYGEIASFMADVAAVENSPAKALHFCILTATRTDETRCARWREVDLEARTWTIPDKRMKAGEEHTIPLSEAAVDILTSLRTATTEPGDYIFAGPQGRPFCDGGMLRLAKKLRPESAITTHGFRSAFRDWAGDETDTPREIAEAALAHKVGGVEGGYRRGTALQKRRVLMEAWASHCIGGTVVPFKRTA